jgi:hypothetical protein
MNPRIIMASKPPPSARALNLCHVDGLFAGCGLPGRFRSGLRPFPAAEEGACVPGLPWRRLRDFPRGFDALPLEAWAWSVAAWGDKLREDMVKFWKI